MYHYSLKLDASNMLFNQRNFTQGPEDLKSEWGCERVGQEMGCRDDALATK